MGRKRYKKREILPDPLYNSVIVSKLINYVMRKGKKEKARKIVYRALEKVKSISQKDPLEVLEKAIQRATPKMEVRARRIGGAAYQVPVEVNPDRGRRLAMRWIVEGARIKKGKAMEEKLAQEILASAQGEGYAVKKKEELHKIAEANKAFAFLA
ncbi:30S ribosomal protein S7 [Candidatus Parcubacteria bacterium]|nr:30S ribosomal protein S7 [Candidatus Parcubacteria bacterium]